MNILPPGSPVDPNGYAMVPTMQMPNHRTRRAIELGVERNLLLITWGGLGDQACSEPTLRYALRAFRSCKVSLASQMPELFQHLQFERVFDTRVELPVLGNYFPFSMIHDPDHVQWQFMSHLLVNCVDYPSLCAFRMQLPTADREVQLVPSAADHARAAQALAAVKSNAHAVVHAGRHWQSKTFPADWWNAVLRGLLAGGVQPVLIGANTCDNRGTVDVDTTGCLDIRNTMSVMETVAVLQQSPVLLTNDSAPLHLAASGNAHIGYVASCKHPDMITHWRRGQWGWRMRNFSLGGVWQIADFCPNSAVKLDVEYVGEALLDWLPEPAVMIAWAVERAHARGLEP